MFKYLIMTLIGLTTLSAQAANVTQINRYATVVNNPLTAQINPLLTVQQIHFPQDVKTVGQAINHWLQYSGYSLVKSEKQPESLQAVMRQPLPQIHKNLGPLTIKDGLEVLASQQVFVLVEDPLLRTVNFKLKPSVRSKV
ncbi:PFGI-1 class ICE element type IV pilus protein PilL2 [Legionella sp. CNM-4043-24]|uniref:PFGI-1 class ICE element type IV pilus protein PilL2 n=1 Tax=Legionella sp. CNM-4043-24 TaxID=3421646 RepID=UPI00403B3383